MRLLEYEAKALLKKHNITIPDGVLLLKGEQPQLSLKTPFIVKSQVPTGGRGKQGGIATAESMSQLTSLAAKLFDHPIDGFLPSSLLIENKLYIKTEFYISIRFSRKTIALELLATKRGGVEVEDVDQEDFFVTTINPKEDTTSLSERLALIFELDSEIPQLSTLLQNMVECFLKNDATLLEINPLVLTTPSKLVATDCKMELDDNAAFRHPEWDFEDKPKNTNFVTLNENGNVATVANGAGLAMATVDAVAAAGLTPANFLDIGGGASEASVSEAFKSILEYPHIKAIIINIFAGITRCDEVAKAIIAAKKSFPNLPPLFIRLDGTNYDEAKEILDLAHINLLPSLEDCLKAAQEVSL